MGRLREIQRRRDPSGGGPFVGDAHATLIQAVWRGKMARRRLAALRAGRRWLERTYAPGSKWHADAVRRWDSR